MLGISYPTESNVLGPIGTHNNNDQQVFVRRRPFWNEIFALKFHLQIYATFFFQLWAGACIPPVFPLLV